MKQLKSKNGALEPVQVINIEDRLVSIPGPNDMKQCDIGGDIFGNDCCNKKAIINILDEELCKDHLITFCMQLNETIDKLRK